MFGLFGGKDWNVLAVIFERPDLYTVSGQRVKGGAAEKARDGASAHPRTIFWAVFDQKGKFLQGGPAAVQRMSRTIRSKSWNAIWRRIRQFSTS